MTPPMERSKCKHTVQVRVRNYEVDWQGIVHNALYLQYFEVGRIEYLKAIGMKLDFSSVNKGARVVLVRNEINYKSPARFDDLLIVSSRVSYIRNTSFTFEGFLEDSASGRSIAENTAIHVWLDPRSGEPMSVPDEFRTAVTRFEGGDVGIPGPVLLT